jgi:GT2 family glycosyltransferase
MAEEMRDPSVAIIVLSWNGRDLTLDCLASLAQMEYPAQSMKTIVVDNGSTDGTAQVVRECFPQVVVLETGENLGFAEGNNVGIRYALMTSVDYVMLLNNDTVVAPDMLHQLLRVIHSDQTICIATPNIYYYAEPTRLWCAGASIDWRTGNTYRLRAEEIDRDPAAPVVDVAFASGCALCIRRNAIEKAGVLDPRFFIYYEETDWCTRILRTGCHCVCVPQAKVWHKISSTMQEGSPRTTYYMTRNRLLFLRKSLPGFRSYAAIVVALIRQLILIVVISARPRHRNRRKERAIRLRAIMDFLRGRFGKMPESYVSST